MINSRQAPPQASRPAPTAAPTGTFAGLLPLVEQVHKQLTLHTLAALVSKSKHAVIDPAADNAVKNLVAQYRKLPSQGPTSLDGALTLIALLEQMNTKVRPQTNSDGSHFAVLSPPVLRDLRSITLEIVQDTQRGIDQAQELARPGMDVVQTHLQNMARRLQKDLGTGRPAAGQAPNHRSMSQSSVSESDSWMLSSDSSAAGSHAHKSPNSAQVAPPTPPSHRGSATETTRGVAPAAAQLATVPKFEGIAGVSIHLPHDPIPNGLVSIKVKWPKALYDDQPFAGLQYSKLYDGAGRSFVLTQTFARGAYGKARRVYDLDRPNANLVAKEIRHIRSRNRVPRSLPPTRVMPAVDAVAEAQLTQRLRRDIETDMRAYDALPLHHIDSLKRARAEVMPFELYGMVQNQAKTYIIMSADVGSVGQLVGQIIGSNQVFALKSLAAQVFSELQAMHETCAMAHLDLSENNVFVTRSGQFKIMDPGAAQPLVQGRTEKRGIRGTLLAPENVGFSEDGAGDFFLTAATDVFAAAAMVATLAAPKGTPRIFDHDFRMPGNRTAQESGLALFAAFSAWRVAAADPVSDRITAEKILAEEDELFSPFFSGLAQMAPELCESLVNDAMALSAKERQSAGSLAHTARSLLPSTQKARDRFIDALHSMDAHEDRQEEFDMASMYHDWETQKTREHLQHTAALKGQPRDLPR